MYKIPTCKILVGVQYTQNVKDGVSYRLYLMNLHKNMK